MNRDSKGAAITDRAPNQSQPQSQSQSKQPSAVDADPEAAGGPGQSAGQPPSNPPGKKDASNTSISNKKSLKQIAEDKLKQGNASQLGDPVSLKAETADSSPTENDRGAAGNEKSRGLEGSGSGDGKKEKALKQAGTAKGTAPTEGDRKGSKL